MPPTKCHQVEDTLVSLLFMFVQPALIALSGIGSASYHINFHAVRDIVVLNINPVSHTKCTLQPLKKLPIMTRSRNKPLFAPKHKPKNLCRITLNRRLNS